MLLLIFGGAGIVAPPAPVVKVFGRVGGTDSARGGVAFGAVQSRATGGGAGQGGVESGATDASATGDSAGVGGVTSGQEP